MSTVRQIIAMGGGGFTMEPGNPLLDDYVLSQTAAKNPKICFLPTASGDDWGYIGEFYDFFTTRHCIPSHLALSRSPGENVEDMLLDSDIIYVGGGHTGRMLELWYKFHLEDVLKKAWEMGIVLAGVSAGASCWFEHALTDSIPDRLTPEKCLGFLPGSHCAHYDTLDRRQVFQRLIATAELNEGFGTENCAALHFRDLQLANVVSSRPGAAAYSVRLCNGKGGEKKMPGIWLGETDSSERNNV